MRKKSHTPEEEINEFQKHMKKVTPLKQDKVILQRKPPRITIRPAEKKTRSFPDNTPTQTVTSSDILNFSHPGLQHKILRQLKQGQLSIEAKLDLHRLTSNQAHKAISEFLFDCQQHALRCVLIIHGKGTRSQTPLLKNKVNQWLQDHPAVLAFHSAKPQAGGTGAVYVLLKKRGTHGK